MPVFDGYRAFAILGVVMLHLITISGVVAADDQGLLARFTWGAFGRSVEVLFVVSGFVVFLPTVARSGRFGSVTSYAIRRAARLLPAYWLILVISLVLLTTVSTSPEIPFPGGLSIASHFTGLQVPAALFFDQIEIGFLVNPPLWTLSVEIIFYVILPLVALHFFRHPLTGLTVAAAITAVWGLAFSHISDVTSALDLRLSFEEAFRIVLESKLQFPTWAFSFALGMTGAWAFMKLRERVDAAGFEQRVAAVQVTSLLATGLFAYLAAGHFSDTRHSVLLSMGFSASLATLMVAIALGPRSIRLPFSNTPVRRLGDISYGIYLVHFLLVAYLAELFSMPTDGTPGAFAVWLVAVMPASVVYGYLSARFLEQPVRRWARKFGRRRSE